MIFIGYANADRYTVVESIVFHLKNWGFHTWYDFHNMYLGDNREKINFEYGIGKSNYIIFIISHNTFSSNCAKEELLYVREKFESGKIVFFPILYEMTADELPREYFWLQKIIYNETSKVSGTFYVVNQIIERMLLDIKNNFKYNNINSLSHKLEQAGESYIAKLLETLDHIDLDNYNARMGILYAIYIFIYNTIKTIPEFPLFGQKVIERIFTLTRLNITIDHLTYGIFQDTIIIDINYYLQKTFNKDDF